MDLYKLPKIKIEVELYVISEPVEVCENGSKRYWACFKHQGSEISIGKIDVGSIMSPLSGGSIVNVNVPGESEQRSFYLSPEELWDKVLGAIQVKFDGPEYEPDVEDLLDCIEELIVPDIDIDVYSTAKLENAVDNTNDDDKWVMPDKIRENDMKKAPLSMGWFGTKLSEIPEPHILYYPTIKPPQVRINIMRYYNAGKHYLVSIHEEDNLVYDPRQSKNYPHGRWLRMDEYKGVSDDDWRSFYKDNSLFDNGRYMAFLSYHQAKSEAIRMCEEQLPMHKIVFEDYCQDYELGKRDGD